MTESRFRELMILCRKRRETTRMALDIGCSKSFLLSRLKRNQPPVIDRPAAIWLSARFGIEVEEALLWLAGGESTVLNEVVSASLRIGDLRKMRLDRGISQEDAAALAGVPRTTWLSWEASDDRGRLNPKKKLSATRALVAVFYH